jgi:hypothetical protein
MYISTPRRQQTLSCVLKLELGLDGRVYVARRNLSFRKALALCEEMGRMFCRTREA